MDNIGYLLTDWVFFFKTKHKDEFSKIINHRDNTSLLDEFITWKLITVFLPLTTFLFVFVLNILSNQIALDNFYSYFNNGSLPIIAFSIITSGMPYLLEKLENYPELYIVRRRVMAIGLIFLFLSASIYIIETLKIITSQFNTCLSFVISLLSIGIFFISVSIGYKMFLLQSKNIRPYDENVNDNVRDLANATNDLE